MKNENQESTFPEYPECYLHVRNEQTGETYTREIRANGKLDLKHNLQKWIKEQFQGELKLSGEIMPRLSGEYYARVITDWRKPDTVIVWQAAGFYLEHTQGGEH